FVQSSLSSPLTSLLFFLMIPPSPTSTLFPYTTLFRSSLLGLALGAGETVLLWGSQESAFGDTLLLDNFALFFAQIFVGAAATKIDRKSTRLNSSHVKISYAVFCLKKKKKI